MNSQVIPSEFMCPKHNKAIAQMNLTPNHPKDRRLLCSKCDYNNQTNLKYIGDVFEFLNNLKKEQENANKQIDHLNQQFKAKKDEILNQLNIIESQIQQLKTKVESNKVISDQALKKYLEKKPGQTKEIDNLIELASIISSNFLISDNTIQLKKELITQEDKDLQDRILQKLNSLGQVRSHIQSGLQKVQSIQPKQNSVAEDQITFSEAFEIPCQSNVFAIQFNRTGQLLALGGSVIKPQNSYLQIWRITDQNTLVLQSSLQGHTRDVKSICFSSKDDSFVTGSVDSTVRYWKQQKNNDWITDQVLKEQHELAVNCVKLSPSNKFIASACQKILLWSQNPQYNNEWQKMNQFDEHSKSVLCLSFNEEETLLISGGADFKIFIMEYINDQWHFKSALDELNQQVIFLSFTDSQNFISFQGDQTMNYWTYQINDDIYEYQQQVQEDIYQSVSYCSQNKLLAYSTNTNTQIYELTPNKTKKQVFNIPVKSLSTQFQKDGAKFALMTEGKLCLYLVDGLLKY